MTYEDIIKEEGDWRVKLVQDDDAQEPYNDGQCPLLRIDRTGYHGTRAEHVMTGGMRPTGNDALIEEAAERWSGDQASMEKYLRAYHGATTFKWYGPNQATDYTYVAYDTPAWVEAIGFDDKCAPRASYDASKAVNMDDYIAYLEGNTWGYVVERRVTEERITRDMSGKVINRETTETWEDVDSCWGFYGHEYAESCALEALESAQEG